MEGHESAKASGMSAAIIVTAIAIFLSRFLFVLLSLLLLLLLLSPPDFYSISLI